MHGYANTASFYEGPEHLRISVSVSILETNPPWILRNDCIEQMGSFHIPSTQCLFPHNSLMWVKGTIARHERVILFELVGGMQGDSRVCLFASEIKRKYSTCLVHIPWNLPARLTRQLPDRQMASLMIKPNFSKMLISLRKIILKSVIHCRKCLSCLLFAPKKHRAISWADSVSLLLCKSCDSLPWQDVSLWEHRPDTPGLQLHPWSGHVPESTMNASISGATNQFLPFSLSLSLPPSKVNQ